MKHLYFCRHGESELNQTGHWAGRTETPLTEKGRAQAKQEAAIAKDLHIDYIIVSPLERATETAHIIAAGIGHPIEEIEINPLVIERHLGDLEGQKRDPNMDTSKARGSEPVEDVIARAHELYLYVQTLKAENVLIVSHNAFGRGIRHTVHPEIPYKGNGSESFENAKIYQLL